MLSNKWNYKKKKFFTRCGKVVLLKFFKVRLENKINNNFFEGVSECKNF